MNPEINQEINQIFDEVLKNNIYEELITYSSNYNIDKTNYQQIVKKLIDKKYNFKIAEPNKIRNLKKMYYYKYNKTSKGSKANDTDWLESKIKDLKIDNLNTDNIESKITYKPRYVSRNHFINKKNKCMARLWNDHYGGQCSRKKTKGDYCNVHSNIILKKGLLQFGRIDELRPERDYFNNNNLNWKN
jgi:hypothetical protein